MQPVDVLLVEDESLVAKSLEVDLLRLGFAHVGTVKTGPEALEFVQSNSPDVVIMDIELRNSPWNGIETTQRIRKVKQIPIIYLTSIKSDSVFHQAKETNPEGFLYKPVQALELSRVIHLTLYRASEGTRVLPEDNKLEKTRTDPAPENFVFSNVIFVKDGHQLVKIDPNDILWIEAASSYCHVHLEKRKLTFAYPLRQILEKLDGIEIDSVFFRIHRGHAVNLAHVTAIAGNEVEVNGRKLAIGRSPQYQKFKKMLPIF